MKRVFRFLYPDTLLSGVVFGYLVGFVWWLVLLGVLEESSGKALDSLVRKWHYGFLAAIPWAVMWGGSGAACGAIPGRHPGTLSTLGAFAFGIGYSLWDGPKSYHPWLFLTVPYYAFLAMIPCHMLGYVIAALFGRIRDPEEAQ
jgi:hypothetical protein